MILKENNVLRIGLPKLVATYEPIGTYFERNQQRFETVKSLFKTFYIGVLYEGLEQKFIEPPNDYRA